VIPAGTASAKNAPTSSAQTPSPADYRALQPRPAVIDLVGQPNNHAPDSNSERNIESPRPKRQRKSRFATLSSEVDASLAVLYRELESVASLKAQIEDLQIQNSQYIQIIQIRDNNMAVLRRELDNQRAENEELVRLRVNTSQNDSLKKELEDLQSRIAQLDTDLQVSKGQTAAAEELVNDWKGKLSQLIGSS
jgi:predicted RNase H-like nuclease (RuvC/YqgF family)